MRDCTHRNEPGGGFELPGYKPYSNNNKTTKFGDMITYQVQENLNKTPEILKIGGAESCKQHAQIKIFQKKRPSLNNPTEGSCIDKLLARILKYCVGVTFLPPLFYIL